MTHIYRDTVTQERILIPLDDDQGDTQAWDITCVEVWDGKPLRVRELHVPGVILERYYKREEL